MTPVPARSRRNRNEGLSHRSEGLSHVGPRGEARMVDVGGKAVTRRRAVATARVRASPEVVAMIRDNAIAKGDVLSIARLAGIMAAKHTAELIPLCHPLVLDFVDVDAELEHDGVLLRATAQATGKTGVEMEALASAAVAALTVYDMCKSVDRGMVVEDVRLDSKSGGKSGSWERSAAATGRRGRRP